MNIIREGPITSNYEKSRQTIKQKSLPNTEQKVRQSWT